MYKHFFCEFTETGKVTIDAKNVTILVGPNSSGKSLFLREVEQSARRRALLWNGKIIKDFDLEGIDEAWLEKEISEHELAFGKANNIDSVRIGRLSSQRDRNSEEIKRVHLFENLDAEDGKYELSRMLLSNRVMRLDGRTRFEAIQPQKKGDYRESPKSVFSHYFKNDGARKEMQDEIFEALSLYLVFDALSSDNLHLYLSEVAPDKNEKSYNDAAVEYLAKCLPIAEFSDGIQAFIGVILSVLSGKFHLLLIDEPEAFLHPPLANRLGRIVASRARSHGTGVVVATHSAEFLMGCVQGNPNTQVVRLGYSSGKSSAYVVDSEKLLRFFNDPLLRNSSAIAGIFYDGVVVTESENDRVIYSEIYYRLRMGRQDYPSILFVNAQNKQTERRIFGPLREFGVPTAAIPDLDFVKEGGREFTDMLRSAKVPEALRNGLATTRASVKRAFDETNTDMKNGGVELLANSEREATEAFLGQLNQYGLFPVPLGELEQWLREYEVPGRKTEWVLGVLEKMGSDPEAADYARPSEGDIWSFVNSIVKWISDGSRKGMP